MSSIHATVLLQETLAFLPKDRLDLVVDATMDGGGHSEGMLAAGAKRLIGLDLDRRMLAISRERLAAFGDRVEYVHSNFAEIDLRLKEREAGLVDAIVADLGFSSNQLEDPDRGLSFQTEGPLDMRLDADGGEDLGAFLDRCDEKELGFVIHEYGEEPFARKIAHVILQRHREGKLRHTLDLADCVANAIPRKAHPKHIHPATRTFQALRIAVNREMENLDRFLPAAFASLRLGGRMLVISFHSLEDRRVRHSFARWEKPCTCPPDLPLCACGRKPTAKVLTRKAVVAGEKETAENPRARSAKLRVVERIAP